MQHRLEGHPQKFVLAGRVLKLNDTALLWHPSKIRPRNKYVLYHSETIPSMKSSAAADILRNAHLEVNEALEVFLNENRSQFPDSTLYTQLYDDLVEFVLRPGKRIRPLLFLAGCRIFQARLSSKQAANRLRVAVALELLHAFVLIHDDIIDQSDLRRNLPTLHRVIGRRLSAYADRDKSGADLALVMGDILFALAQLAIVNSGLDPATNSRLLKALLRSTIATGFGETADIVYGLRDISKVGPSEIEQMYLDKTTRYTVECPLIMAAIASDLDEQQQRDLERIAEPAGLAFQIQNDLEEFERFEVSDVESADILEGKKTVLIRSAFDRLPETDRGILQLCLSGGVGMEASATKVRELVLKSGAVGALRKEVSRLFEAAENEIDRADFTNEIAEGLKLAFRGIGDAITLPGKKATA